MPDLSQQYGLQPQGSTMFVEPARKKKKRRTPLSCVKCRERKIKCDRTRPICLRCTKSKLNCYYDIPDPNLVTKAGGTSAATSMVFEITKTSNDLVNSNKDNNISGNIINSDGNGNNYPNATTTADSADFQLGQSPQNSTQQQHQQQQQLQQQQQQKVVFPLHYQIGSTGSYPAFNAQYLQQQNPSPDFRGFNDSRFYQMSQNIPLKRSSFASVASRPSLGYLSLSDLPNMSSHQVVDAGTSTTPYLPPPPSTSMIQGQQMQVVQQPHQSYVAQHMPSHNSQISLNQQLNHRPSSFQQRPSLPHLYNSSNSVQSPQNDNQNSSAMRRQAIGQLSTESIYYQISQLKSELEDLQAIVTKRGDVFSLSIDADNNFKNFNHNKQAFNGTFVRTNCWKRDTYMQPIVQKLREKILTNGQVPKVDLKNLNAAQHKVFNDLTEQVEALQIDRAKKPSPTTENEDILKALPPKEIIYYHLDRFFKLIYPFIPIIDEKSFKSDVTSIIDRTSDFSYNLVTFKLASLVILLRLSYITLYLEENLTGSKKLDAFEIEVLSFKINTDIIKFIQEVIYQANFIRNMDLPKLQFLFLYRFYQINAPEDGDGESGNTGVLVNGLIAVTVKALGLNKKLDELEEDRKYIQLFKKLWWSSGVFDADYSLNNGRKPLLDFQQSDTGNPLFDPFSSNLQNVELEKFSIDRINKFSFAAKDFTLLMNALHKISNLSSTDEIEHLLENFTTLMYDTFDCTKMVFRGKLYKYSSIESDIANQVDDFKVMIMFFSMNIIIQYYLLLHAEKTNNVFKYIIMFPKLLNQLFAHFHKLENIYQCLEGHLTSYRIILGHVLTESMYKIFNVIIPIIIRLDLLKYQIEIYNKSDYIQQEIPKPQNYNSYIYPDPNPLNKEKLLVINELRFKIARFMRDGLRYMKNFSIWIYKARRYYGQTKCIFELVEREELVNFELITPGSKDWTNNLLMSVDIEVLKDVLINTDWNLSPMEESDFQYEDDDEKFDASRLWNWGKLSTGNDEFETL